MGYLGWGHGHDLGPTRPDETAPNQAMRPRGRDPDLERGGSSSGLGYGFEVVGAHVQTTHPLIGQESGATLRTLGVLALLSGPVVDGWER